MMQPQSMPGIDLVQVGPGAHCPISIELEDSELWSKFHAQVNEMIVTKGGRRMFPLIKVKIKGLEPTSFYSVLLEFKQIDNNRWKYINGEWLAGGKSEPAPRGALYTHPDSPNYGSHWSKEPINFQRVKLTNKTCTKGKIMLNSLHKYEPRIHVIKVDQGPSKKQQLIQTFAFPTTQFIAVTAYQNEDVTALKIRHNPFAKAFQQDNAKARNENSPDNVFMDHFGKCQVRATDVRSTPYRVPPRRQMMEQDPLSNAPVLKEEYGAAGGWMGAQNYDQMQMYSGDYSNPFWNSNGFFNPAPEEGDFRVNGFDGDFLNMYRFNNAQQDMSPAFSAASSPQISPDSMNVNNAVPDNALLLCKPENISPPIANEQYPNEAMHNNVAAVAVAAPIDPWTPLTPPNLNQN